MKTGLLFRLNVRGRELELVDLLRMYVMVDDAVTRFRDVIREDAIRAAWGGDVDGSREFTTVLRTVFVNRLLADCTDRSRVTNEIVKDGVVYRNRPELIVELLHNATFYAFATMREFKGISLKIVGPLHGATSPMTVCPREFDTCAVFYEDGPLQEPSADELRGVQAVVVDVDRYQCMDGMITGDVEGYPMDISVQGAATNARSVGSVNDDEGDGAFDPKTAIHGGGLDAAELFAFPNVAGATSRAVDDDDRAGAIDTGAPEHELVVAYGGDVHGEGAVEHVNGIGALIDAVVRVIEGVL